MDTNLKQHRWMLLITMMAVASGEMTEADFANWMRENSISA